MRYLCNFQDGNGTCCLQRFARREDFQKHELTHEEEEEEEEEGEGDEGDREQEETDKKLACEYPDCGKQFSSNESLKRHQKRHNAGKNLFFARTVVKNTLTLALCDLINVKLTLCMRESLNVNILVADKILMRKRL